VWSDVSGRLMMQLRTSEGVQEGRGHVTGLIEGPGFRKDSPRVYNRVLLRMKILS